MEEMEVCYNFKWSKLTKLVRGIQKDFDTPSRYYLKNNYATKLITSIYYYTCGLWITTQEVRENASFNSDGLYVLGRREEGRKGVTEIFMIHDLHNFQNYNNLKIIFLDIF